jgi:hypothetical protein
MIAPGNSMIQALFALAFVIATGYASGRIHQWYKHGVERDQAYRNGYNLASNSMFDMALRKQAATAPTPITPAVPEIVETPQRAHAVGHSRQRIDSRRRRRATN